MAALSPHSLADDMSIDPGWRVLAGNTATFNATNPAEELVNNGELIVGQTATFNLPVSGSGLFSGTGTSVFNSTLSPGNSPGIVHFDGDVVLGATATLIMELAGTMLGTEYDHLDVGGTFSAGGILEVRLLDGFIPSLGDTFDIVSAAGGVIGTFDAEAFPMIDGLEIQANYLANLIQLEVIDPNPSLCIPGDTSPCDGLVDIVDLNAVRNAFGSGDGSDPGGIPGDAFPFDGMVDITDLNAVRNQFGSGGGGVPEPSAAVLIILASLCVAPSRRFVRR